MLHKCYHFEPNINAERKLGPYSSVPKIVYFVTSDEMLNLSVRRLPERSPRVTKGQQITKQRNHSTKISTGKI